MNFSLDNEFFVWYNALVKKTKHRKEVTKLTQYTYPKLTGRIIERYGTRAAFSRAMGISEHSISTKLTGKHEWKQSEIEKACTLLEIRSTDIPDYFFVRRVKKN